MKADRSPAERLPRIASRDPYLRDTKGGGGGQGREREPETRHPGCEDEPLGTSSPHQKTPTMTINAMPKNTPENTASANAARMPSESVRSAAAE